MGASVDIYYHSGGPVAQAVLPSLWKNIVSVIL